MQTLHKPKTTDPAFLAHVESCIDRHGEGLVLFRYPNAGGSHEYNFIRTMNEFIEMAQKLRSRTWVISYGEPQLPLRGVVDEAFIDQAFDLIPKGREYLVVGLEKTVLDFPHFHREYHDNYAGETHEELREDLARFRGKSVAVEYFRRGPTKAIRRRMRMLQTRTEKSDPPHTDDQPGKQSRSVKRPDSVERS